MDLLQEKFQEIVRERDDLALKLSQKTKDASKYKDGYYTVILFVAVFLVLIAILKFKNFEIVVSPESKKVIAISSSWWGLKTTEREIRWMKIDGYDSPGWMTKGKDGRWYLYLLDDDHPEYE
ncbi:MAG: hypothetical protein ABIK15_03295 [Pseudomonadota bacterium]